MWIKLKNIFLIILLFGAGLAHSCSSFVIGFKGSKGAFDQQAFLTYVGARCWHVFRAEETEQALQLIQGIRVPFELYGFSLGAQSVREVLKRTPKKPVFVLTLGAYHTANVNFDSYQIPYFNIFDDSGSQQKSPGIKIFGVPHMRLQAYANQHIFKL